MPFFKRRHSRVPARVVWLLIILVILAIGGTLAARALYNHDLAPVSSDSRTQLFTVNEGSSVKQIGAGLEKAHLIRSAWAMELYVHSKDLTAKLEAGTYDLSPSQSMTSIVATLSQGRVAARLVTILPGRRIDQVQADLINAGFTPTAVYNALNPSQYAYLPVLAFKPAGANLEGLLWPDSFQKLPSTDPSLIIRESLTEMGQHLTPDVQSAFAAENLNTYQGLTLASIVMQEVSKPSDQAQAAQVFISRLKSNMFLGSDVTALYGAIAAGLAPNLNYNSAYNTLVNKGLPPGPISTISDSALMAAAHPAPTNWLYFVAGDDGTTYFTTTFADQQALAQKYCHKLCSQTAGP